jgi:uroporphyrinogen-III synthase
VSEFQLSTRPARRLGGRQAARLAATVECLNDDPPETLPLSGDVIGVTADRRGDDQAVMFRRLGAEVVLAPMIHTLAVPDGEELREQTLQLISSPPDYLIANTGFGIRMWMNAAEEWGLREPLGGALERSLIAARGPKAAGSVTSAGLKVWWRSPDEQLASTVEHVISQGVVGTRVALQLHGLDSDDLVGKLTAAGAEVVALPVYRWTGPEDSGAAMGLIESCCEGRIDAVTFTAGPQVRNMVELAEMSGRRADLLQNLGTRVLVGCIGPVCAGVAHEEGIKNTIVPDNWRLGSLVKRVAEELVARSDSA